MSRQGRPGRKGDTGERGLRGEKGDKGDPGEDGAMIVSWHFDKMSYRYVARMSNGQSGPELNLREALEYFLQDVGGLSTG